jgi:hypothetical protein
MKGEQDQDKNAMTKRIPKNKKGPISASASLTTTKVAPQIIATNNIATSAWALGLKLTILRPLFPLG